ncbi:hypothetical protein ACWKW1_11670 [Brevibacillus parabrevis]
MILSELVDSFGRIHARVLDSIAACQQVGIQPIKLNVVLMKGIDDDEIAGFLRLTIDGALQVRFIEYMPIGHNDTRWKQSYLPLSTVLDRRKKMGWNIAETHDGRGNGLSHTAKQSSSCSTAKERNMTRLWLMPS